MLGGMFYGLLNIFAKLSFESGVSIAHFILWRHVIQVFTSFLLGYYCRNTDFTLAYKDKEVMCVLLVRSAVNMVSKCF